MRKLVYILLAAIAFAGCGNNRNIQKTTSEDDMQNHLVGAFGEQRELTPEEMAMFRKSTADDSLVVYTPLSVSTQVVAGINYRFWCRFENISDGIRSTGTDESDKYGHCWVTVFKPLPGQGEPRVTAIDKETL